jgi:hypothetical protein
LKFAALPTPKSRPQAGIVNSVETVQDDRLAQEALDLGEDLLDHAIRFRSGE